MSKQNTRELMINDRKGHLEPRSMKYKGDITDLEPRSMKYKGDITDAARPTI